MLKHINESRNKITHYICKFAHIIEIFWSFLLKFVFSFSENIS